MTLRVVPDVDEELGGVLGHVDPVEQGGCSGALLVDADAAVPDAVGVPDGVRAALGDAGQKGPRRDRPVDAALRVEAIASYSAHNLERPKRPFGRSILLDASARAEVRSRFC